MGESKAGSIAKHICGRGGESKRPGDPVSLWQNRLGNPAVRAQLLRIEGVGMKGGEDGRLILLVQRMWKHRIKK